MVSQSLIIDDYIHMTTGSSKTAETCREIQSRTPATSTCSDLKIGVLAQLEAMQAADFFQLTLERANSSDKVVQALQMITGVRKHDVLVMLDVFGESVRPS